MGHFKRVSGKQDPVTNSGEALPLNAHGVPHIAIKASDGLVLMRQ